MPKAYLLSIYHEIKDADAVAAYAKLALPAIQAAGGTFLARGMPAAVKENGATFDAEAVKAFRAAFANVKKH